MNNKVKIVLALLAVAAIGGFAGILLAPDEGAKTRDKLAKKGKKLLKATKDTANEIIEKSSDIAGKVYKEGEKIFS